MLETRTFYSVHDKKMLNLFQLPLFNEIIELENPLEIIKEENFPTLYQYFVSFNENNHPHLTKNS